MSWLEVAANAINLLSIWLASRNSLHTWWTGIVGCALFGVLFGSGQLYADVSLQGFFVVTSAVGWRRWLRGDGGRPLRIRRTQPATLAWLALASLVVALAYGLVLWLCTDAFAPFFDSAGTAASVLGQLLLMERRVESWWFWLIANTIYVPLYAVRGLGLTALLYVAFWVNAVVSLRRWRRLLVPPRTEPGVAGACHAEVPS